ncbi:MAG: methyltransferase domain-containing protein [Geobacteraceae bacterium]|nr:methyltransferase domain-containing protein [Geobacteraceae bacterium]
MSSNIMLNSSVPVSSEAESFYKDFWKPYVDNGNNSNNYKEKQDFVVNRLLNGPFQGKAVLEIGVGGEGGIIAGIKETNDVRGVDVSESAVASCEILGIHVEKVNCDRAPLPYPQASFDIVIAMEVFEHFANPQYAVEQIARVLKADGVIVISTPAPYTYHWPRLFYPSLFERHNFMNFLLSNGFIPSIHRDPFFSNTNARYDTDSIDSSWSYYWLARKIKEHDSTATYDIGKYFLEQRDQRGLCIRPIEALEFLKRSIDLGNKSIFALTDYLRALFYRVINGDTEEFQKQISDLMELIVCSEERQMYAEAMLIINKEAELLGKSFLDYEAMIGLQKIARKPLSRHEDFNH